MTSILICLFEGIKAAIELEECNDSIGGVVGAPFGCMGASIGAATGLGGIVVDATDFEAVKANQIFVMVIKLWGYYNNPLCFSFC